MTPARSQKVMVEGSVRARLARPEGRPRACAVSAHCFTCSKDIGAAARIAGALAERGVAVLRFDFTGPGSSEGEFANSDFILQRRGPAECGRVPARRAPAR